MSRFKAKSLGAFNPLTQITRGIKRASQTSTATSVDLPPIFLASVSDFEKQREGNDKFKGVNTIKCVPLIESNLGQKDKGSPPELTATNINPYFKCVPMPGEVVVMHKGMNGQYFYSSIVNHRGNQDSNIHEKRASILTGYSNFFFGVFGGPRNTKRMDLTEGDVMLEGRSGQSIRFTTTSEESFLGKLFKKTENKPAIMITCHNDEEEGIGNEVLNTDDSSIYLLSKTPVGEFELESKLNDAYTKLGDFENSQIIIRSDRVVISSREDNILLSGGVGVGISTSTWKVDFDLLMAEFENLVNEMVNLAQGTATYGTGVGPTMPATNLSQFNMIKTNLAKMKQ